jgi:hypothetical protein
MTRKRVPSRPPKIVPHSLVEWGIFYFNREGIGEGFSY